MALTALGTSSTCPLIGLRRPQTLTVFFRQFGTQHRNLAGGLNAQAHLVFIDANHGDADLVANVNLLHQLPRQNQHGEIPRVTFHPHRHCRAAGPILRPPLTDLVPLPELISRLIASVALALLGM